MKWPFRRKADVSAVPAEIQDYYQSERRERTGIAWLLALGTLLVTIGLATLLFFGGRWAYRAIIDNDDDNSQETTQVEQNPQESQTSDNANEANRPASTGTSSTSTSTPNAPSSTQGTATATTTSPASRNPLPDTGAGDIVAIFVSTTIIATAAHYALTRRLIF